MPTSISQHLSIDPDEFKATGVLDAILDVDSKLFIDPHLLQSATTPELKRSYRKLTKLFSDILTVLSHSKSNKDSFWKAAVDKFYFPELRGLCIGYSAKGTQGSGMGPGLRSQILKTAKEIIDVGIDDPAIFELVGLFQERVGPDRISDMVGRVIVEDLRKYTQRILTEFKIETQPVEGTTFQTIVNPFNNHPLILLPREILRDLPIADSWEDIDFVSSHNQALRGRVNKTVGKTWKHATTKVRKSDLRAAFLREPELLADLIDSYKKKPALRYDFESDPAGQYIWHAKSLEFVSNFPLELRLPPKPSTDDLVEIVLTICRKFKDLVENNGLSKLLYDSVGKSKREEAAQLVFYGIADAYCSANGLDLSREANAGRGPVDFKISTGYIERVLVEAKLTTNPQLLHGFETQIVEYQKAEKTASSIYLIIDVKSKSEKRPTTVRRINKLRRAISATESKGQRIPNVIFVDGMPKVSASKF